MYPLGERESVAVLALAEASPHYITEQAVASRHCFYEVPLITALRIHTETTPIRLFPHPYTKSKRAKVKKIYIYIYT
jgi:hypothetical protein